jgi:hypothetical protein
MNDDNGASSYLAMGLFSIMMFSYHGYSHMHYNLKKCVDSRDMEPWMKIVAAVSGPIIVFFVVCLVVVFGYSLYSEDPLKYLSFIFPALGVLIFLSMACLCFCCFFDESFNAKRQQLWFALHMDIKDWKNYSLYLVWLSTFFINASFYSFMPIATDWYFSDVVAAQHDSDSLNQSLIYMAYLFSAQIGVQVFFTFITSLLRYSLKEKVKLNFDFTLNLVYALILTASLFAIAFAKDASCPSFSSLGIVFAGFGNPILQRGVEMYKSIGEEDQELPGCLEPAMVGQLIPYPQMGYIFFSSDDRISSAFSHDYHVSFIVGGVFGAIASLFCFFRLKWKSPVRFDLPKEAIKSRKPYIGDDAEVGKSIVFRGVFKRH